MKTLTDLLELITSETRMNEGKMNKYTFEIDTNKLWVSMFEHAESFNYEKECDERFAENTIFLMEGIKNPAEIQMVYWTIHNRGRSKYKG